MKAILTLIFVLFIGVAAQAQNPSSEVKVETIAMGIVTEIEEVTTKNDNTVARLYRFKNSLVKKELSFATKKDAPKLA
jgi:hypothetical protein